jgi:hypothetical protein
MVKSFLLSASGLGTKKICLGLPSAPVFFTLFLAEHRYHLADFVRIERVILPRRTQQLRHQNIVYLFCFHAFEGQMQTAADIHDGRPAELDAFFHEILHETLGIRAYLGRRLASTEGQRQVTAADHERGIDQVAVERPRDLDEFGLLWSVRQNGVVAS